ncbi:hypothetical protein A6V39_04885 [Candidatus Mycoplasma haematobovis]|uniref:Uncharacterized protein n=1 Tax=Candidatus Mycoplasma haematobovis TaxID=432608 RepID=A0A1A9QCB3_9MOLU|nr:hypothetical protein [Candidatus Mycoplasma haematobovis]OAL09878.1 hypothetical protein A6V39_04885 [Candidatus Mycoplasma haematobovis]
MSKIFKLFYNSEDNWKKASKRVIWLWLGQIAFWIAAVTCLSTTASNGGTEKAGFISTATVSVILKVFLIVANILINFNYFKCVKKEKSLGITQTVQGQKQLLWIDLFCCFTPLAILTKFFFWKTYRKMPRK